MVSEPTVEDTIAILRGLKERYEVHHGIHITDAALVAAATLSNRYISDRFLPDKAIDLVDEAASKIKMEIDSLPVEIDQIDRKLVQLRMEEQALKKERDKASKARVADLGKEVAELNEQRNAMRARWLEEKESIERIREAQGELESLRAEEEQARRKGDLGRAAEIHYGKVPELERRVESERAALAKVQETGSYLREEVTDEDIATVVSKWTGVPVSKMLESEMAKLLVMEDKLRMRVVGQDRALVAVADAVRRSRAGLGDQKRPIGSFLFLGPTGVGKTETARSLAEFLFDDERAMILRTLQHPFAATVIATAAVIALPTVIMAFMYGQSRIFFVMARDGLLPRSLAKVSKRSGSPVTMTVVTGVIVAIIAGFLPLKSIAELANAGTLCAFVAVAACMMILRKRDPDRPRVFRTPWPWVVGPLAIVGCLYLFLSLPGATIARFFIWNGLGLLAYVFYGRHRAALAAAAS
jgi:hypothetical protein